MKGHRELTDEEYRLFSERIARGLAERPLTVQPREHREQVAELVKQLGDATFYHLLGIDPTSGTREVHEAYEQLARLVHPSHARRLGLEGREGVLKLLFERTTLAYLTLIDTDRRKAYDREAGPSRWTALRTTKASKEEEARRCYEQARALSESEDFHSAIELLRRSVSLSPKADAYGLLGLLLAKNPQWLGEAADCLQRAEAMGATEPGLAEALQEVREKLGQRGKDEGKPVQPIPFRKPRRG